MKLITTANGHKTIDDWDVTYVPVKLRDILHEHRATLINNLLKGKGIETYVNVRFNVKITPAQAESIRESLFALKHTPLEIDNYRSILELVLRNENTFIDNELFFQEIELQIKGTIMNNEKSSNVEVYLIDDKGLREAVRKDLVREIQTEAGLKKFVIEHYHSELANKPKLLYLLDEVRDYFRKEPSDFKWLHNTFSEKKLGGPIEGNGFILEEEVSRVLETHFNFQ